MIPPEIFVRVAAHTVLTDVFAENRVPGITGIPAYHNGIFERTIFTKLVPKGWLFQESDGGSVFTHCNSSHFSSRLENRMVQLLPFSVRETPLLGACIGCQNPGSISVAGDGHEVSAICM